MQRCNCNEKVFYLASEKVLNFKYMDNFKANEENKNPFAYFTRVLYNAFIQIIKKEKEKNRRKDIIKEKVWEEVEGHTNLPNSVKKSEKKTY